MNAEIAASDRFDVDVVVVGAGPIGLTTACALAHHGVSFRIFERADGLSGDSKGHNLVSRPQELLHSIGVQEAIAAKSYRAPFTQFILEGRPFATLDSRGSPTPFGAVLFSNQGTIEQVLLDSLSARDLDVEFQREVRTIEQDAEGVSIQVFRNSDDDEPVGEPERLRCRYLVGADGSRGTVRKAVGLDFEPDKLEGWAIRQIDGVLNWHRTVARDTAWFFIFPNGFAGVLPVWEGAYRLFLLEDEKAMPARKPTREEMVARAREVTGDGSFDLSDPSWFSYGTFQHGVAPGYAKERVFLAGDAGHCNLPIGGQGMNAGLYDAVSLAWRLAMTLAGAGGKAVLASYGPERHSAAEALGKQEVRGFKQLMRSGPIADKVVDAIGRLVPKIGSYVFGGGDLEQLAVGYPDSNLSQDHFSRINPLHLGAPRAGDRAPDARVATANGQAAVLFDFIYNPDGGTWSWRLLLLDGADAESHARLGKLALAVSSYTWVKPLLVVSDSKASMVASTLPAIFDLDALAHEAYGLLNQAAIVLIRPDGHIAFRGRETSGKALTTYLASISV